MPLFEITLVLLAVAVVLLRWAKKLRIPYPSLLALGGGLVATLPFAPHISIEPQLALALFVAPAVMDSAFDLPPRELLRNWIPLFSLAVVLVLLTTAAVAWAGVAIAGLPVAAAIVLGAIVSPPDAAAAAAVLREFSLPRRTMAVLQGESLLNDAVALLVFGVAVAAANSPGDPWAPLLPRLLIAVPGGAVLGIGFALLALRVMPKVAGTQSAIIVQFLVTFGAWLAAERLGLSPIMTVVALAAVAAQNAPERTSARDRVNTNVIWTTVLFVLNVLAFLLMGLQARSILARLHDGELSQALVFSGIVLAVVVCVRFAWVMSYGVVMRRLRVHVERRTIGAAVPKVSVGILVSWCGMRGLVTLATAFALPPEFPGRDVIVLSAFTVVLGTLIVQGFTIRPLIALLKIAPDASLDEDVAKTRAAMLDAALAALADVDGAVSVALRAEYGAARAASATRSRPETPQGALRIRAIAAERQLLIDWRRQGRIFDDAYHILEDELDRAELNAAAVDSSWLDG